MMGKSLGGQNIPSWLLPLTKNSQLPVTWEMTDKSKISQVATPWQNFWLVTQLSLVDNATVPQTMLK